MSRIVIQADGLANSIPLSASVPGVWMGTSRADLMKAIFSLAAEKGFSVDVEGQHWPTPEATPEVMRLASNKLSRGHKPASLRRRHGRLIGA